LTNISTSEQKTEFYSHSLKFSILATVKQDGDKKPEWRSDPLIDRNTPPGTKPVFTGPKLDRPNVRGAEKIWKLTFSDEFTQPELDKNKWNLVESHRGAKNGATKWWRKSNIITDPENGQVRLKFIKESVSAKGWMLLSSGSR